MLFRNARRDGAIVDDPAEFVDTIRQRSVTAKRAFKLEEIRGVLDVADDEWRSMILSLYRPKALGYRYTSMEQSGLAA